MPRFSLPSFGIILLCWSCLTACGEEKSITPRDGGTHLIRVNGDEIRALDPHKVSVITDLRVVNDLFQGLTDLDPVGRAVPGQAAAWTISQDGLVWTFKLRDTLVWSDGVALTAQDFVYSFRRLVSPETSAAYANFLLGVENAPAVFRGDTPPEAIGVTALDDSTLEIKLSAPQPAFPEMLAHGALVAVPQHIIERHGDRWSKPETLVGNGAFTLESWQIQASLVLKRNPKFHDAGTVAIEKVTYLPISDATAAMRRFRAGDVDIVPDFPSVMADKLRGELGKEVQVNPYQGIYYWAFHTQKPPFQSAETRQALSMLVDRAAIINSIMRVGNIPAYAAVPPNTGGYGPAYRPAWADWPMDRRQKVASQMLADAGITPQTPIRVQIKFNTSDTHQRIALAVAQMWKPFGVQLELFNTEAAVHFAALRSGDFVLARAGWIADYDAAENFLFVFTSNNAGLNYPRYNNPKYDVLVAKGLQQADFDQRVALMRQADKLLAHDSPIMPLHYYVAKSLIRANVTGWAPNPAGQHRSRWLGFAKS